MTKKKLPSIAIDAATFAAMQEYAASSGLALPELVARMWALWQQIEQAHETLFPRPLAGDLLDNSLEKFLAEMLLLPQNTESESTEHDN